MQKITSGILQIVSKALRLDTKGSEITEFDDAVVQQALNIEGLIRRGGTVQSAEGVFKFTQANTHAVADTQNNSANPYDLFNTLLGATDAIDRYDVWFLGMHVTKSSGAGNITFARMTVQVPASNLLTSVASQSSNLWLGAFDGPQVSVGTIDPVPELGSGKVWVRAGIRVPRGSTFVFQSVSDGAAVCHASLALGLFPKGLGQDIAF